MSLPFRRVRVAVILVATITVFGTLGFRATGLTWVDAVYQTVITISTTGYQDLTTTEDGRVFTIVMVAFGTVSLAVLISLVTGAVVESQLHEFIGRRKVESRIRKLSNHFIICGGGRFGRTIADELVRKGADFVVIEADPEEVALARERGSLVIQSDATEEASLQKAGIERARGLLTTLPSDADNVYVTITAKQLVPEMTVVSIALAERAARKLKAAGADEVVAPYVLGGNWMAQIVTSPNVADFMKMATGTNPVDFYMDEQRIAARSTISGMELKDTPIRSELGVIVIAIRREDGELLTNPSGDLKLRSGDVLVSMGQHEKLAALKELAQGA